MKTEPDEMIDGRRYTENCSSHGGYAVYDATTDEFLGYTDHPGYLIYDRTGAVLPGAVFPEPDRPQVKVVEAKR